MTKQVAKTETNTEMKPSFLNNDSARGQENVGIDDLSIPRLGVIQALSPQRKKSDPAYIEGAEEGQLFNSVTNGLYGTEVGFIPCYFRKEWLIWKEKAAGGGFQGSFNSELEAKQDLRADGRDAETVTVKGATIPVYEVVDTAQHFGLLVLEGGRTEEIVISMSKSKMKTSRQLNTLCKMVGGDRFSSIYNLKSVEVNGEKGDCFSMAVTRTGYVDEDQFHKGEALYEAVAEGGRTVNNTEPTGAPADDSEAPRY